MMFPCVKRANTKIQIHKYTNTAYVVDEFSLLTKYLSENIEVFVLEIKVFVQADWRIAGVERCFDSGSIFVLTIKLFLLTIKVFVLKGKKYLS